MSEAMVIKGDLDLTLSDARLEFKRKKISLFGVGGLPWDSVSLSRNFGRYVDVKLRIPIPREVNLQTKAVLTREQSAYGKQMGLRFFLDEANKNVLAELIQRYGYYPKEFARKYPRIPSSGRILAYPLRVLGASTRKTAPPEQSIVFNTCNLSPEGILVSIEKPLTPDIRPGNRFDLYLQTRSDPSAQISVDGMVCRVIDYIDPESGNLIQYLAMKFVQLDRHNRTALMDLLTDIQRFEK